MDIEAVNIEDEDLRELARAWRAEVDSVPLPPMVVVEATLILLAAEPC